MTKFVDICQPSYSITAVIPVHNRDGVLLPPRRKLAGIDDLSEIFR